EPEGAGRSRWEMVMLPSLNVKGVRSGWVGAEARTIVPDVAVADLDFRLVADVRPERQVERLTAHLRAQGYHVVHEEPDAATRLAHPRLVRLAARTGYPAVRTPMGHPAARAVLDAVRRAARDDVVAIPTMGGSVPGYVFPELLGATFVNLPIVNPDNNQHSPNENLRLGDFFDGIVLLAAAMRVDFDRVRSATEPPEGRTR
ncbi:MAG: peptidase M20, partial [Actinobacteria bacterium]|nr:peptidase M20 [Actinomycetota bacterium]NIU69824.1 peptidase M20 [Actinomycetota bacterium]NIV89630.1 peptidase M20 [Actinomycetota bacterium]NIW31700.1 peptidase M20 [Actinomycetota bacterium]